MKRRLTVPIFPQPPEKLASAAEDLRTAGADRVFITVSNLFGKEPDQTALLARAADNIRYYHAAGFSEVGIWIIGLGHGGDLSEERLEATKGFTRLRSLTDGAEEPDSFCPLDENFAEMYTAFLTRVSECRPDLIMIDDDLRISMHRRVGLACACDRHMTLFNRLAEEAGLTDHPMTREELAAQLFTGKANPLRSLWMRMTGDTMRSFAARLHDTVERVDPGIRLGHCACMPTWDADGIDNIELARILAGHNRPFLRLIGAPYWCNLDFFRTSGVGSVADLERMQFAWTEAYAPEIEVCAEGDVCGLSGRMPTPAIYLEAFDQMLGAEEHDVQKYLIYHNQYPLYRRTYLERHAEYRPLYRELCDAFENLQTSGVYVHETIHKVESMDCTGLGAYDVMCCMIPGSVSFINGASLPCSFRRTGYTRSALVFGESARDPGDTADLPLILDAVAAKHLTDAGEDVGLLRSEGPVKRTEEAFEGYGVKIRADDCCAFYSFALRDGAEILSRFEDGSPASYRYENAAGRRFLVYAFDADRIDGRSMMLRCYPRQQQLIDSVTWLQREPLDAATTDAPALHMLVRRSETEMAVGIWNGYADTARLDEIVLGETFDEIRWLGGCTGELNGDRVRICGAVPTNGFAGFRVRKKQTK